MPYSYTIQPVLRLVRIDVHGVHDHAENIRLFGELISDPGLAPGMRILIVAPGVRAELTFAELRAIAERVEGFTLRGIRKLGIVVSEDYVYGLARTFSAYVSTYGIDVDVFMDETSATEWLEGY